MAKPGHIYHWKHGWIPITPRAAMIKAKGSHSLGERYMHRYGVEDRRVGGERRTERVGEGPAGRGSFRYVKGTKTRDYPDRVPGGSSTHGEDLHPDVAFRMKKPELEHHAKNGSVAAQKELDRRAARTKAAGGKVGGKREAPFRPEPKTEAPKAPTPSPEVDEEAFQAAVQSAHQARAVDAEIVRPEARTGNVIVQKDDGRLAVYGDDKFSDHRGGGLLPGSKPLGRIVGHVDREGNVTRGEAAQAAHARELARYEAWAKASKAPEAPKPAPEAPKPVVVGYHTQGPAEKARAAREQFGVDSPEHKAALAEEDTHIAGSLGDWPSAGPGHRIKGQVSGRYGHTRQADGTYKFEVKHAVVSTHYAPDTGVFAYRPIGTVKEVPDGQGGIGFAATRHTYTPKRREQRDHEVAGGKVFANREEAHKALATEHTIAQTKSNAKAVKDAERKAKAEAERKATAQAETAFATARREANNRALTGVAGPNGTRWEPHHLPATPDMPTGVLEGVNGTGYSLKAGRATVLIDHEITPDRAKHLLANVSSAMERVEPNLPAGKEVTFRVHGKVDDYFNRKPDVGAFVLVGDTTVHINHRMVTGDQWASFTQAGHSGHFMPAAIQHGQDVQEFTLVHELGHVIDGQNRHTRPDLMNHDYNNVHFHRQTTRNAGAYAQHNPAEGYAEAFAQHTLGGTGSHPVATEYAKRFGWADADSPSRVHELTRISAQNERIEAQRRSLQDAASSTGYQLSDATRAAIPTPDTTVAAKARRAAIAKMSDAELADRAKRHTNGQTLRFIKDEQARRAGAGADAASLPAHHEVGATVHVGTDLRYVGKGTVKAINGDGTALVEIPGMGTGRVGLDQMHPTKTAALANVKPMDGGGLAAMGGNKVARRVAAQQRRTARR